MQISLSFIATALLSLTLQGKDGNPEFAYWAEVKVGSWVKLKMEMETFQKPVHLPSLMKVIEGLGGGGDQAPARL